MLPGIQRRVEQHHVRALAAPYRRAGRVERVVDDDAEEAVVAVDVAVVPHVRAVERELELRRGGVGDVRRALEVGGVDGVPGAGWGVRYCNGWTGGPLSLRLSLGNWENLLRESPSWTVMSSFVGRTTAIEKKKKEGEGE